MRKIFGSSEGKSAALFFDDEEMVLETAKYVTDHLPGSVLNNRVKIRRLQAPT
jgi:hypothetical protein